MYNGPTQKSHREVHVTKEGMRNIKRPLLPGMEQSWFDKDKDYFGRLCRTTRAHWRRDWLLSLGLICLCAALQLYLHVKLIAAVIFFASGLVMWVKWWVTRRAKAKKPIPLDFDPISLGTLHFAFALSLWTIWASQQTMGQPITAWETFVVSIIISLISLAFFVAAYNNRMKTLLNTRAVPSIVLLTFLALVSTFVLGVAGSPSAFPQISLINRVLINVIVPFGLAWIVTILLVMLRDAKNELAQAVILAFLLSAAIVQFPGDNNICGAVLLVIVLLAYLVVTNHLAIYGRVFEK